VVPEPRIAFGARSAIASGRAHGADDGTHEGPGLAARQLGEPLKIPGDWVMEIGSSKPW
jgi:hypothetical protein